MVEKSMLNDDTDGVIPAVVAEAGAIHTGGNSEEISEKTGCGHERDFVDHVFRCSK